MANISTLTVNLVTETARFTAGLKKSRRDADRFAASVKKSLTIVASLSAVAGGALITLARQSTKAADGIGKTAKAVGLTAETLQELRFAAQQTGVDMTGLDDSVRRFNRRLGEFATSGGGPAAQAIKNLGVNVRDTNGQVRSSELVFNDVVDQMSKIESQAQRAALAAQLFGDDYGPKLTPLLDQGIAGIAALRKEARDLGIVISNESVASAEDAEDAFGRLTSLIRGRAIKAFADNAETITAAAEALTNFAIASLDAFDGLSRWLGLTELGKAQNELKELQETLLALQKNPSAKIFQHQGLNIADVQEMIAIQEEIIRGLKIEASLRSHLSSVRSGLPTGSVATPSATAGIGASPELDRLKRQAESIRDSLKSPTEKLFEFMDLLDELENADLLTADQAFDAFGRRSSEVFANMKKDVVDTTSDVSEFTRQAARNMQDAFADFFFDPFDDGLKGMLRSFTDTIRRMVANLIASDLLRYFSSFGGAFGAFFSLGAGAALGGFRRGAPFVAGEHGPELISPGAGSTVDKFGATFSFVTNISGGALEPATLIPILEENNRVLKGQFLDELRRGEYG